MDDSGEHRRCGNPGLVDRAQHPLCAGQLSAAAKGIIVTYVANTARFPYSAPTGAKCATASGQWRT